MDRHGFHAIFRGLASASAAAVQTDQVCGRQAFDRGPATIGDIDVDNQAIGLFHVTEQLHGRGKMMVGELSGQ